MKKAYLFIIISIAAISCTPPNNSVSETEQEPKAEEQIRDELYQEVIEIHDIAMIKMQTIMNLKSLALKESDSLRELGDDSLVERIELLEKAQLDLEEANKSMMQWMRAFRSPIDTVSHNMVMDYLRSEQDKIANVSSQMDQAIEIAKITLD